VADTTDPVAAFRAMRAKQEEAAKSGVKRPWRVTLTQEFDICVIASSRQEAEELALEHADEEAENQFFGDGWDAGGATPLLQAADFEDSIPYGGEDDKTVDEWLAELEAPK